MFTVPPERAQRVPSLRVEMIFEHLARTGRSGSAVSGLFVVPALRCRVRAVIPTGVAVGIYPTFPERVDHRSRVARLSTAGAAAADWRPWWIGILGPGGTQHRHRRDGKRGSDCK